MAGLPNTASLFSTCRRVRFVFRSGILFFMTVGLGWLVPASGGEAAVNSRGFAQRAYIWQRAWTADFQTGMKEIAPAFSALDVLVTEISWQKNSPTIQRITPDWALLKASERPVGLVVRVGPFAGDWAADSIATNAVVTACQSVLAEARHHGIDPVELQLDFDAATARLAAYGALLRLVRERVGPPRLVITALPDWLRSPDFAGLIGETDCYVLQVHSLEKPRKPDDQTTLFDPRRSAAWIAQASAIHHPFRIALPAYGYRLAFDPAGKFAGLEAEGTTRSWPDDYQFRLAIADPRAVADFVRQLLATPPASCAGLAWFRMPNRSDALAWSWPTLHLVMQGTVPKSELVLQSSRDTNGSYDLRVVNQGVASTEPTAFRVEWREARLLASDTLAGWQFTRLDATTLLVRPPAYGSNGLLRSGESIHVGWIRLNRPAEFLALFSEQ